MAMREARHTDTMYGVRLLIYNIRYATGTGPAFHLPVPGAGYLRSSRAVLSQITEFIKRMDPDVVGLIEVDTGSIRTGMVNQADYIARTLGHYSTFECKYGVSSVNQLVPIVRKQANAFLAAPRVRGERFHYFDTGIKRLIIELELDDIAIFLVHLSLKFRHRQYQLRYLYDLVRKTDKAGHRRRRLQHLLGRSRDLPLHAGGGTAPTPTLAACPPTRAAARARSLTSSCTAHRSRSTASRFRPCSSRIICRWSAISPSMPERARRRKA